MYSFCLLVTDKRPESIGITVSDKSRENCRYWPNCTLGNKCAYFHPPVMCRLVIFDINFHYLYIFGTASLFDSAILDIYMSIFGIVSH